MRAPQVDVIPCLRDNYAYLVHAPRGLIIIDACEAAPISRAIEKLRLTPVAILSTHHHHDHVGGNLVLQSGAKGQPLPIYGHTFDAARIPGFTNGLSDGETFEVGGLPVTTMHVPGHTLGAVAYVIGDAAFTGDTLFTAGCGRLFEGTAEMMWASLQKLCALPGTTRLYSGHEYAVSNLTFAQAVEPNNLAIRNLLIEARTLREHDSATVPSSVGAEREVNVFARAPSAAAFAKLRAQKDTF